MDDGKRMLLDWIAEDEEILVEFLSAFVQAKSPNPPGDTREAAAHVCGLLDREGLAYRVIAPRVEFPNVVASFEGEEKGRHLVLNGHMDVFPVGEHEQWRFGAWSGAVAEGAVWGRGSADMKCGTTASLFTYRYLHRLRERLRGRLTLTAVSDEETFGPWGARYLMEHHPEVHGDCCLNGEPSSPSEHPLRREGAAVAGVHGEHRGRARRLRSPERERDQDCRRSHRRSRIAQRNRLSRPRERRCGARTQRRRRRCSARRGCIGHRAESHRQHRRHSGWAQGQHGAERVRGGSGHPVAGRARERIRCSPGCTRYWRSIHRYGCEK